MRKENHFFRFLLGFVVMIGVSFSITIAMGIVESGKLQKAQAAAASRAAERIIQEQLRDLEKANTPAE